MLNRIRYIILTFGIVFITVDITFAAQYARPNGIVSSSGWSPVGASTIWEATDEPSPPDDNDYMITTGSATGELHLSDVTDPGVDTGHTFKFRATSTGGGGPEKFNVRLLDGTTEIDVHNNLSSRGSYTTFSYLLDAAAVANISDYSNLRIEVSTTSVGNGEEIRISWIELELPDASAATEPTVTSQPATIIDTTSARLWATITDDGGDTITERGTVWDTTSTPRANLLAEGGTATGSSFPHDRSGLPVGTLVYFAGYATNGIGTGYSADSSFYTEPLQASGIGFANVTDTGMRITWSEGTSDGTYGATVSSIVIVRQVGTVDFVPADAGTYTANADFESGTPLGPTNDNYVVFNGTGTQVDITGLTASTLYYVAVYAHVGAGSLTNYQQDGQPTNSQSTIGGSSAPTVSTPTVSLIDATSATLGATITDDGGDPPITSRGTVWDTSPTPRLNLLAEGGTAVSVPYSHTRSGLYEGTLIYFAGYASNGTGTGYSADDSFYTEPGQASTIGFTNIADTAMRITWTAGTSDATYGATVNSVVIVRQVGAVNFVPVDGTPYTANSDFGSGAPLNTDNYVVYSGTGTQVDVSGLTASTTYNVAVYANVGADSSINYQQDGAPTDSQQTSAAAVLATLSTPTATAIDTTSATLGAIIDSDGGGAITERGTVWDVSSAPTANAVSEGGTSVGVPYSHGRAGLYEGSLIYYRGYADNSAGRAYSPEDSFYTEPGQASTVGFANITETAMRITWTAGSSDGTYGDTVNSIVVVREVGTVDFIPVDGSTYSVNANFGSGTPVGPTTDNYVVFNGTGTQVDITGLAVATTYYVAVYAYVGPGGMTDYQQDGAPAGAQATTGGGPVAPTLLSPTVSSVGTTSATLGATIDNDGGGAITARGTVWDVTSSPTANQLAEGGTSVGVPFSHNRTGLYEGTLIYYSGYAFNSLTGYSPEDSFYTEPGQATGLNFTRLTGKSMNITWTAGTSDGTYGAPVGAVIVVKQGSAVTQAPVDGVEYTGAAFSAGTDLGVGEYVVYSSTGTLAGISGLAANTTYYVAVYAYVGSGSQINYQQVSPAIGNETTGPPSHNDAHGITNCLTCHAMHTGIMPRDNEQVTACMDVCHKLGGAAENMSAVSLHTADGGATIVDCGSCHDIHSYDFRTTDTHSGGVTAPNLSRIRRDTSKYEKSWSVDGAVLEPALFQQDPAHFAFSETDYPVGPYNGICQTCHTRVTKHTNDGWDDDAGAAADNDHEKGSDCIGCHAHESNFAGAGGGCTGCHDKTQDNGDGAPTRRAIVGEFGATSHHVSGGVTDDDCGVCHYEAVDGAYHKNNMVDLRDPDDGTDATLISFATLSRNTSSDVLEADVVNVQDNFCMKCHDGGGATATNFSGNALRPFSSGTKDVPDVFSQFNTGHSFYHPVIGVADNPICDSITMESPWNQGDHDLITCFDCHTVGGHGSDNQRMLRTAIDFDQMEVAGAAGDKGLLPAGMGATVEAFCGLCHKSSVYVSGDLGSVFEYHGANQNQHGAAGGNDLGCLGCHAGVINLGELPNDNGFGRGNIHGASFDWSTTTSYASTPTDIFMLGGWIGGWDINGSEGQCTGGECNHSSTKSARQNYTQALD